MISLSWVGPFSTNVSPAPATRSFTVLEAKTSPPAARWATHGPRYGRRCPATPSPVHLDLAGMKAGPHLDSEPRHGVARSPADTADGTAGPSNRPRASRRRSCSTSRPRKRRARSARQRDALENVAPRSSPSQPPRAGRLDDVGKHHRRQYAVDLDGSRCRRRHESPDLLDHRIPVAAPGNMIGAGQLDIARIGDAPGKLSGPADTRTRTSSRR